MGVTFNFYGVSANTKARLLEMNLKNSDSYQIIEIIESDESLVNSYFTISSKSSEEMNVWLEKYGNLIMSSSGEFLYELNKDALSDTILESLYYYREGWIAEDIFRRPYIYVLKG